MAASRKVYLASAMCSNRGIGIKGDLPWRLRSEMKFFTDLTTGSPPEGKRNVVLMGRKSYFSIPSKYRPLNNRINIVLSRQQQDLPEGVYQARDYNSAIIMINTELNELVNDVFVIGGNSVYQAALDHHDTYRIYLTVIHKEFECDTFFPDIEEQKYQLVPSFSGVPAGMQKEKDMEFEYTVYERKKI